MDDKKKEEQPIKDELWCNYSDLPSPLSYMECADYDGMGNQGRFVEKKK